MDEAPDDNAPPPAPEGRELPHSLEAEQAVLGGLLLNPRGFELIEGTIAEDDFFVRAYGAVFAAMADIRRRGQAIDLLLLKEELDKRGRLALVGGAAGLAALTEVVATGAHVEQHAALVREKALLRRLIQAGTDIVGKAAAGAEAIGEVLGFAEKAVFDVTTRGSTGRPAESVATVLKETWEKIEKFEQGHGSVTGQPTGYHELDETLAGLHEDELIIIAGRPAMGKSTFALNVLRRLAVEHSAPVLLFTLEMSSENIVRNLLCAHARVDAQRMRKLALSEEDRSRLLMGSDTLHQAPIWIDDTPAISLTEMRSKTRLLQARHGVKAVFVDYLQLMTASAQSRNRSREQEVSEISRGLKALAKELGIPVIALSQLSRKPEGRQDNKPILSDLRESGAIEQDADVVLLLHRPDYYNKDESPGQAEVIIAKQRNGPTATVNLTFINHQLRFENLTMRAGGPGGPESDEL